MTNYTEKQIEERAWNEASPPERERFKEIAVGEFIQQNEIDVIQWLLARGKRKKMIQNYAFEELPLDKAAKQYAEKHAKGICKERWMQANDAFRLEGEIWAMPPVRK